MFSIGEVMSADDLAKRLKPITKERAIEAYQELKDLPCLKRPNLERQGSKATDYFFFKHRLRAKTKRNISFLEALKDKKTKRYLLERTRRIKKGEHKRKQGTKADAELRKMYDVFQLYFGTIDSFRSSMAKYVYCLLKPKVGILDTSAGWGGRCLAAMAMDIPYTGIDSNKTLEPAYKAMLKTYEPGAKVNMIFKPAETVDFSKFKYDLVFTSPPYFMLEKYEKMPSYQDKQEFMDKMFVPVLEKAWTHLASGGHMALNMPSEMYDAVKHCLPKLSKKVKMPLMDRHAREAAVGNTLKKGPTEHHEFIYIWKKRGNKKFDADHKDCGAT